MSAKVKRNGGHAPAVSVRLYDMRPGKKPWRQVGVEAMEITIYLPDDRAYAAMKPRVVSYMNADGVETALRFTGARIAPSRRELRRLCLRLAFARSGLVDFIRALAANYGKN